MVIRQSLISIPFLGETAPTLVRRSATRALHYDSSLPESFVEALWEGPEALLASGRMMRQTEKARSTVLVEWAGRQYVAKHYGHRSFRHTLKQRLVGSQARLSFEIGRTLADGGVRTPRPVAYVDNRGRLLGGDSYLIYPYIAGRSLFEGIRDGELGDADIAQACRRLKALWRQLIALKVGLRDANTGNIIVTPEGRLWLIDLDDCRLHRSGTIARARLHRRWIQLCRNLHRTRRVRDGKLVAGRRAA